MLCIKLIHEILNPGSKGRDFFVKHKHMEQLKIAIQGVKGAFHEIAARNYFSPTNIDIIPCLTFDGVIDSVTSERADFGIMAIENVIAGSILSNYNLIKNSNLKITGETFLRIQQNLIGLPGQDLSSLEKVYSHPVAIAQCRKFLKELGNIEVIETDDTALSVKNIADKGLINCAAIGSALSAEMYNMQILQDGIETFKKNQTRFLLIQHETQHIKNTYDKASLHIELRHETGSLAQLLAIFSKYHINLTKIQSIPIVERDWEYSFFIDIIYPSYQIFEFAMHEAKLCSNRLDVLGQYHSGKLFHSNHKIEHHEHSSSCTLA